MKIRSGFVSNSSSSSFIVAKPKNGVPLSEIIDFYGISDEHGRILQENLAILIWDALNYGDSFSGAENYFRMLISDKEWEEKRGLATTHDAKWYNKVEECRTKWNEFVRIEVGDCCNSELRVPFDVSYELDNYCKDMLTKPENGFAVSEH